MWVFSPQNQPLWGEHRPVTCKFFYTTRRRCPREYTPYSPPAGNRKTTQTHKAHTLRLFDRQLSPPTKQAETNKTKIKTGIVPAEINNIEVRTRFRAVHP